MVVNADVLKAVVSFMELSRKWHLKEFISKYGLGDFDVKLYHMAPKSGGKSDNFDLTTDKQWNLHGWSFRWNIGV